MKRLGLVAAFLLVVLLAAGVGGWFWLSFTVKARFIADLNGALKADVHFQTVTLNLYQGRIEATGGTLRSLDAAAPWERAEIDHLTGTFALGKLFAAITPVQLEISGGHLLLQIPDLMANAPPTPGTEPTGWPRIELEKITVHDLTVATDEQETLFSAHGIEVSAEHPTEDSWEGTIAGAVTLHGVSFGAMAVTFASDERSLSVENFSLNESASSGPGMISGHCTVPRDHPENSSIHFQLRDAPLALLLPTSWQTLVTGRANGQGDYTGPLLDWRHGTATAHVDLTSASLQALPFLQSLAQIPGLSGLATLSLDLAHADFQYTQGAFSLTNVALAKNGTLSFQGHATVGADSQLDGLFDLGLPTATVAIVPGLKDKIFNSEHDGYDWASVKISGTPGKLQEDLSPRLIDLARDQAAQVLKTSPSTIDQTIQKATDVFNTLLK